MFLNTLKFRLIQVFDFIDDRIIRHRYYSICRKVGFSRWWDLDPDCGTIASKSGVDYIPPPSFDANGSPVKED
jgi:hypothetical protein